MCYKSELINVKLVMMIPFQAEGGWKVGGRFHLAGKKQMVGLESIYFSSPKKGIVDFLLEVQEEKTAAFSLASERSTEVLENAIKDTDLSVMSH